MADTVNTGIAITLTGDGSSLDHALSESDKQLLNFRAACNNALTSLKEFEKPRRLEGLDKLKEMGNVVLGMAGGGALLGGAGGIASFARDAMAGAAHIHEMSEELGIGASRLQELQYAATESGVSVESLQTGLGKLQKIMGQDTATKETAEAFDKLGLTFEAVKALEPEKQLDVILEQLGKMPAGAERTAVSMELLGKSGATLLPMIQNLDALSEQAHATGNVLDDETIRMAKSFEIMTQSWSQSLKTAIMQIMAMPTNFIGDMMYASTRFPFKEKAEYESSSEGAIFAQTRAQRQARDAAAKAARNAEEHPNGQMTDKDVEEAQKSADKWNAENDRNEAEKDKFNREAEQLEKERIVEADRADKEHKHLEDEIATKKLEIAREEARIEKTAQHDKLEAAYKAAEVAEQGARKAKELADKAVERDREQAREMGAPHGVAAVLSREHETPSQRRQRQLDEKAKRENEEIMSGHRRRLSHDVEMRERELAKHEGKDKAAAAKQAAALAKAQQGALQAAGVVHQFDIATTAALQLAEQKAMRASLAKLEANLRVTP